MDSLVAPKKRVPTKLNTPLAHNFGFDHGDLQDNRSGFISHWQKKRLRWYLLSYSVSIAIWIFLLTIFPAAFIQGNSFISNAAILWVAGVFVVFGVIWLWQVRSVFLDIRHGNVAELISPVRHIRQERTVREIRGEHIEMDYFVQIGRERFITSKEQMESFDEGLLYHVYIATESRQILSAEPHQEGKEDEGLAFLYEKSKQMDTAFSTGAGESQYKTKEKR